MTHSQGASGKRIKSRDSCVHMYSCYDPCWKFRFNKVIFITAKNLKCLFFLFVFLIAFISKSWLQESNYISQTGAEVAEKLVYLKEGNRKKLSEHECKIGLLVLSTSNKEITSIE